MQIVKALSRSAYRPENKSDNCPAHIRIWARTARPYNALQRQRTLASNRRIAILPARLPPQFYFGRAYQRKGANSMDFKRTEEQELLLESLRTVMERGDFEDYFKER